MALGNEQSCPLEAISFALSNHKLHFWTWKYEFRIHFKKKLPGVALLPHLLSLKNYWKHGSESQRRK